MGVGGVTACLGTGVRAIDVSHEGLGFLLGRIFEPGVECRRQDGGCDHSSCCKIAALLHYLGRNFAEEEALMAEHSYKHLGEHRREHALLVEELRAMQAARTCGERDHAHVRHSIDKWAVHHYAGCDQTLGRWATTRRVVAA